MRPEVITGLDIFAPKEGNDMDPGFAVRNTSLKKMSVPWKKSTLLGV
jgi:hypothetical protein